MINTREKNFEYYYRERLDSELTDIQACLSTSSMLYRSDGFVFNNPLINSLAIEMRKFHSVMVIV